MLSGWGVCLSLFSGYSQDQKSGDIISAPVYQYGHLGIATSGECGAHEVAYVDGPILFCSGTSSRLTSYQVL